LQNKISSSSSLFATANKYYIGLPHHFAIFEDWTFAKQSLKKTFCWNHLPDSVDFSSLLKFRNSLDAIDFSLLTG